MTEDSWWSEDCRLSALGESDSHGDCDATGCDCSCHISRSSFVNRGNGLYQVLGAKVSPTTGLYVTGGKRD